MIKIGENVYLEYERNPLQYIVHFSSSRIVNTDRVLCFLLEFRENKTVFIKHEKGTPPHVYDEVEFWEHMKYRDKKILVVIVTGRP